MGNELKNKVALVTGANRGTGSVIAEKLLQQGAKVMVHRNAERSPAYPLSDTPGLVNIWGDITDDEGAAQVLEQTRQHVNEIHILVNNYGQALPGKWESLNTNDWINAYQINFLSTVRMCQMYIQNLKSNGYGRIINLSTIGTFKPSARMPHYYAAKAALSNMTVSLAKELSGTDITVNCVAPSFIKSDELEAYYRAKAEKKNWGNNWDMIEAKIAETECPNPMNRIARREEVADLVAFLASPRASFINAQTIRIDGGAVDTL